MKKTASSEKSGRLLDVTVVLLEGGYASTAVAPIEIFHAAGVVWNWLHGQPVQPHFRVQTASIGRRKIKAGYPLSLTADCEISDIKRTDVIIVPASGWDIIQLIAQSTPLLPWLKKHHEKGAYVAGICSGVAFLAECGMLDGRQATTHWGVAEIFQKRYPKVRWRPEQFVTEDSGIFCSGGVYAAIDLSLYLVEKFCGHEVALQCAKSLLLSMPRGRQSGYSVVHLSRPHSDERIRQAEEYLQQHFDSEISIDDLARRTGMGSRNFIRRFKAATGRVPGAYLQTLRVSAAKEMLETGNTSIQAVCSKIGYEDIGFFRNLFKRHTGMTPGEYRDRFSQMRFERGELVSGRTVA
ncbi:MAG TPA: helix-turn-helix domain-containing protein [Pseudolabrys sp.]|nr:helix-turn-helix domain-containing protein [Pseudolabrys sp.]